MTLRTILGFGTASTMLVLASDNSCVPKVDSKKKTEPAKPKARNRKERRRRR